MTSVVTDTALTPYRVGAETFLIPWSLPAPPVGHFPMHSMVIRGAEPVLVDTGAPACRDQWLEAAWSVVDPTDVRWVFLSHDDRDHSGNLLPVLTACPNATLLTSWFAVGRMFEEWETPLHRVRFVNNGERVDLGDRSIVAVRPPVFDNPTTRGVFDTATGIYWAVDTFATNMPDDPVLESDDLSQEAFRDGQLLGSRLVAPWHEYLDFAKWQKAVDAVADLPITTVLGCHTPVLRGERIAAAIETIRQLPNVQAWQEYTQDDLESWMAAAGMAAGEPPAAL